MEKQDFIWIVFRKDDKGDYEYISNVFSTAEKAADWKSDCERRDRWSEFYTRKYVVL